MPVVGRGTGASKAPGDVGPTGRLDIYASGEVERRIGVGQDIFGTFRWELLVVVVTTLPLVLSDFQCRKGEFTPPR